MKLEGKVAIITGAARGIGREIALTFAKEGANVAIADINEEALASVSREIGDLGRRSIEARVDISNSEDVSRLVTLVIGRLGKIDILINNAAYVKYERFLDFEENDWDRMMDVDLKGYFLCSQYVAREMVKNRKGRIISMASIAGEVAFQKGCAYCSVKGGVIALTKVMAIELARYGINVNAIAPGPTDTGELRRLCSEKDLEERISRIPLARFGIPEEIAKAALFLASEDSNYVTGYILRVDGGFTAAGILGRD